MYPHFEEKNSTLRERRTRSVWAPNVFRTASTFSKRLKYFVNGRSSIFTTGGNQTPTLFGLNAFAMGPPESAVANQAAGATLARAALEPAPLCGTGLSAAARFPDFFPHERLRQGERDHEFTSQGLNAWRVRDEASTPAGPDRHGRSSTIRRSRKPDAGISLR